MYVCICAAVTDDVVRSCIAGGARSVDEVGEACEAGTGCGSCHDEIADRIDVFLAAEQVPSALAA
jgi:bacterioferritin-associated ferredoxin